MTRNILKLLKRHPLKELLARLHQGKFFFYKNFIKIQFFSGLIPKAVVPHVKDVVRIIIMNEKCENEDGVARDDHNIFLTEVKGERKEMSDFMDADVVLEMVIKIIVVEGASHLMTDEGLMVGGSVLMISALNELIRYTFYLIILFLCNCRIQKSNQLFKESYEFILIVILGRKS